jgi:predicted permease
MEWLAELWRRAKYLFGAREFEADLEDELEFHLQLKQAENQERGLQPAEARAAAIRQLGNRTLLKEESRRMWIWSWLEAGWQDTRHAFRLMRRNPGFTLIAVASLALGLGANTVVFSVLDALLLKPLPIARPEQVYFVNGTREPWQSYPNYLDLRDRNSSFESLFAYSTDPMSLSKDGSAELVWGYIVTGNYFQSLGIRPAIGRFFTPAEDVHPNASPFAVLSYACWQSRFGGSPDVVGKEIRINQAKYTVLGVAPRGFHGTEIYYWPEIWVPMMMEPQIEGGNWLDARATFNLMLNGRLKKGVTAAQAEADLNRISAQLARTYAVDDGMQVSLAPPGLMGSRLRAPVREFAGGVMFLAVLVLLAACANLAGLLAARSADRSRDLALRVSIGAGRGRIARQMLTESLWLSLLGGLGGYSVAVVLLRALSHWRAPVEFPIQFDVAPEWRVFLFALAAAVITGLLFGIAPVRSAWKADPALALKSQAGEKPGRRWSSFSVTTRDLLLPIQVALCCVLVTASFAAARGLMRSLNAPLGFEPDGAATVSYDLSLAGYSIAQGVQFQQRAGAAVARLPGVDSVAYASSVPLSTDQSHNWVYPENTTDFRPKYAHSASWYAVSPGYFRVMGTRLLAGREFTPQDVYGKPLVAAVNETFARTVIGTTNAVGRHFRNFGKQPIEVVAVVEDGKYGSLTEAPQPAWFVPLFQSYSSSIVIVARARRNDLELAGEMRQAVAKLDPRLPVYGVGSLRQMLGFVYLPMHAAAIALGAFGLLAIMLSVTGIYGLAAYTVSRRTREIGIRMAIGARPAQVLRLIFGRTGVLVSFGAAVGLVLGAAGAKLLASIVYQASARDPVVLIAGGLLIALIGLAAAYGPARRALRIDPVQALRAE